MKKIIFALLFVLIPALSFGANVPVRWDRTVGATGYRIEQCLNDPAVGPWTLNKDVPGEAVLNTTITLPDTGTIHLRLAPYNNNISVPRTNAGVWFNFTLTPLPPGQGFAIP